MLFRSESKTPTEEQYILKMSDIQAAKLRARLVVLSCCHSGQGPVSSEGVVGMARAFLWLVLVPCCRHSGQLMTKPQ